MKIYILNMFSIVEMETNKLNVSPSPPHLRTTRSRKAITGNSKVWEGPVIKKGLPLESKKHMMHNMGQISAHNTNTLVVTP